MKGRKGKKEEKEIESQSDLTASSETTTADLPPRGRTSRARGVAVATAEAITTSVGRAAKSTTVATRSSVAATAKGRRTAKATTHGATHIPGSTGATAAATSTASTATETTTFTGNALKERGNLLVGLLEEVNHVADNTTVSTVEESSGNTGVTSTTSTTDTVNVVINVGGKIVVDNVGDIRNIQTTSSNSGCDKDRATTRTEHVQSTLTLALGAVTVDGGGRETLVQEEVRQSVCHALCLNENKGETSSSMGVENVKQDGALVVVFDVLDPLGDVLGGRANTTNGQEDVVLEEVTGQHLDVTGESGRKHESLALADVRHVLTLHNTADLGFETHVQHAVSLIQNQVFDVDQRDTTTLDKVNQTTGGSDQQVTATLNLAELGANVSTTIHDTRADPGAVGKFLGFFKDLRHELTGGGQDQGSGVGLALTTVAELTGSLGRGGRRTVLVGLGQDGEQETTSLSGTSLSTSHQVTAIHDDGDGVLLDRGGDGVSRKLDVGQQVVIQRGVCEGVGGFGDIVTGGFHGDIVVVGEVDTGVLLGRVVGETKELTFHTGVGGSRDMGAVTPLAIAGAFGLLAAVTTATCRLSVSIWVKRSTGSFLGDPAGVTIETTGVEIVGAGPVSTSSAEKKKIPRSVIQSFFRSNP